MKYCLYCTCMGTLASSLKEEALRSALGPAVALKAVDRLCDNAACRKALEGMAFGPADTVVAAACSKGAHSSNVPVDYTKRRFVKKPSGAKPGFVIYTNQKTLYVDPEKPAEA